jgi:uncharacterized protein (DUF427 family)
MASLHPVPPFEELTYYPTARWIRGPRSNATVVDSRRAILVWEPGRKVPIYAFPADDVALYSTDDEDALGVREFGDPDLDGYVTIAWDAIEHWYEEEEEIFVHPRDPFVRVDALHSSRHVRVERDGEVLASSENPILVFETGLPTRYYLPEGDVEAAVLADSDRHTGCPYKGFASYHDAVIGDSRHPGLFWYYESPFPEVAAIKGHLAPYNERVDLIVDGELQDRPASPLRPAVAVATRPTPAQRSGA